MTDCSIDAAMSLADIDAVPAGLSAAADPAIRGDAESSIVLEEEELEDASD